MDESGRQRRVYRLLVIALAALLWAVVVGLTGGFVLSIGGIRLSSRNMRNALILCGLALAAACAVAPRGRRMRSLLHAWTRIAGPADAAVAAWPPYLAHRTADALAAAIAIAVVAIGVAWGSFVVGGSDSYGYVSQARLWAAGRLRVQAPFGDERPAGLSIEAFTPLGYRPAPDGQSIVPTYAPGFPLLAAIFEYGFGRGAGFYLMPIMAGITVLATYLLGIAISGRAVGLFAAVLMALSPAFLFQLTHAPMSDIVAACWWTLAFVLLPRMRTSWTSSLVMGLCAAAAILTRPNLAPLAIVPGGWLLWEVTHNPGRRRAMVGLVLYVIGPLAASLAIAGLNRALYGSVTESGYGPLAGTLFQWGFLWPNIVNYSRSIVETHTPAIVLAMLAPFLVRSSLVMTYASLVVVLCLCYAVYLPIDVWWALRFFLPVLPIVLVFLGVTVVHGTRLILLGPHVVLPVVIAALIAAQMRQFSREMNVLDSTDEQRFEQIGRYVAEALPRQAVVFAVMHSGSVNFYSGRVTVRFDAVPPGRFQAVASEFERRRRPVFILLDRFEKEDFEKRFGALDRLATLDARASALVPDVALYRVSPGVPP